MRREYIVRKKSGFGQRMGQTFDGSELLPDNVIRELLSHCAACYDGHGRYNVLLSKTSMYGNSEEVYYIPLNAAYLEIDFPDDMMAQMWEFFDMQTLTEYSFTPLNCKQQQVIDIIKSRSSFTVEPGEEVSILLELQGART